MSEHQSINVKRMMYSRYQQMSICQAIYRSRPTATAVPVDEPIKRQYVYRTVSKPQSICVNVPIIVGIPGQCPQRSCSQTSKLPKTTFAPIIMSYGIVQHINQCPMSQCQVMSTCQLMSTNQISVQCPYIYHNFDHVQQYLYQWQRTNQGNLVLLRFRHFKREKKEKRKKSTPFQ